MLHVHCVWFLSAAQPAQESLEDLLRCLNQQIKGSDWLQHNTADKWIQDNPEAAQELQHIIAEKQASSAPTSSQQAASAPTGSQQAASAPTISLPSSTQTPSTQWTKVENLNGACQWCEELPLLNVRIQQSTKESVIALQVRRMFLSCASSEGLHKFSQTVEMHVRACLRACVRARARACVCVCVCVDYSVHCVLCLHVYWLCVYGAGGDEREREGKIEIWISSWVLLGGRLIWLFRRTRVIYME